ncbi:MAG TPA: ferritin-like domain-containing protein [Candidatus Elarobacter sp.]|nr:ferritin-like domain-containing protein [Candidatus Elarobacter sp.]
MKMESLHDLYVDELKDLWSAERQILVALPKMIRAASHPKLKRAFTMHERQTRQHVKRLERICRQLGVTPRGKKCAGMEGVIREGAELIQERPEADVLDAGLIAAAQHVEHYEMAGYGCVRTYARLLGHEDQAELLQRTLDEEKDTDELLSELAESSINIDAEHGGEEGESPTRRGARTKKASRRRTARA